MFSPEEFKALSSHISPDEFQQFTELSCFPYNDELAQNAIHTLAFLRSSPNITWGDFELSLQGDESDQAEKYRQGLQILAQQGFNESTPAWPDNINNNPDVEAVSLLYYFKDLAFRFLTQH
jgi:hypothetical protein